MSLYYFIFFVLVLNFSTLPLEEKYFVFECGKQKMASLQEPWLLENGNLKGCSKEIRHGKTAHNRSSSSLRKKSDLTLVSKVRCGMLRQILTNLQEVILGTKLSVLFPAIPLAIVAECYGFGRVSFFFLLL